jgi:hypothetical protein
MQMSWFGMYMGCDYRSSGDGDTGQTPTQRRLIMTTTESRIEKTGSDSASENDDDSIRFHYNNSRGYSFVQTIGITRCTSTSTIVVQEQKKM